jgi:Flp pilus assembly protein TadD
MTGAAVVGCVALGGFALMSARSAARVAAPPTIAASAVVPASIPARVAPDPEPRPDTATSGAFAARDASVVGIAAYKKGDLPTAIDRFTSAVEANPRDASALNNLGQVLVRAGRAREAITYFDRAIALNGDSWAYHFNRARAYAELKDWPRAADGYRRAAQLFPDDYATQFNLAKALQAGGDLPAALAAFERAIALAPGAADFQLSYGLALEAASRPRDAAAAYRRYLDLEPAAAESERIAARIAELEKR